MNKVAEIIKFYDQVKAEAGKVSWPIKSELINSTLIVLAVVIIFSLFCLSIDYGIHNIVQYLLKIGS